MKTLPWHASLWDSVGRQSLPSALLLAGRAGMGKLAFAKSLAQRILCETAQGCGKCQSCKWLETNVHPDYQLLEPAEENAELERRKTRVIKVDQVRELKEKVVIASSGTKVFLLNPAESMNANAQNALLKLLEEPPCNVLFILVSHKPQRLLPTILSRCRRVSMPEAHPEIAVQWLLEHGVKHPELALAAAGGAPLLALRLSEQAEARAIFMKELNDVQNALELAQAFQKFDTLQLVHWLQQWTYDLMLYHNRRKIRYNIDCEAQLSALAPRLGVKAVHALQREFLAARGVAEHALNAALFMEQLSFSYCRYTKHG
jgi:DNA polymerase-3 subunit delta'